MPTTLITGANRGIGLAMAREFIANGHEVIATARDAASAAELIATGANVKQLDVSDPASIAALKADIGDTPLDYLINNAGISGKSGLGELDYDEFAKVLQAAGRFFARRMRAAVNSAEYGRKAAVPGVRANQPAESATGAGRHPNAWQRRRSQRGQSEPRRSLHVTHPRSA